MSRTILNFWLDALLLVTFVTCLGCALVLRFVFPPGITAEGWRLWGLDYDQWFGMLFGCLCFFAIAVVLHVMLHWTWVCGVITSKFLRGKKKQNWSDGEQTLIGVGLLVVIFGCLGIVLTAATMMIEAPK